MGIRARKGWTIYESITEEAVDPWYYCIEKEELTKYLKKNPFPRDPAYSWEDLVDDLLHSNGYYCLPNEIKEETVDYITELLNEVAVK